MPPLAEAAFDIRITPHTPPAEIKAMIDSWINEINSTTPGLPPDGGLSWEFVYNPLFQHHTTSTDPEENPWWRLFSSTLSKIGIDIEPSVFPAATDSRFLRAAGVNAIGFSPIRNSPVLLHEHDEYIEQKVFEEGLDVYVELLRVLSSQGEF